MAPTARLLVLGRQLTKAGTHGGRGEPWCLGAKEAEAALLCAHLQMDAKGPRTTKKVEEGKCKTRLQSKRNSRDQQRNQRWLKLCVHLQNRIVTLHETSVVIVSFYR